MTNSCTLHDLSRSRSPAPCHLLLLLSYRIFGPIPACCLKHCGILAGHLTKRTLSFFGGGVKSARSSGRCTTPSTRSRERERRLRVGVYFGESTTRCGHGVLQAVNTKAPRGIPSWAKNIWIRSRWRQRCKHLLCNKVRGHPRGYCASRQAGPSRGIDRQDRFITLWLHELRGTSTPRH